MGVENNTNRHPKNDEFCIQMTNFVFQVMSFGRTWSQHRKRRLQAPLRIAHLLATLFVNILLQMQRLWRIASENDDFLLKKRPFNVQFAAGGGGGAAGGGGGGGADPRCDEISFQWKNPDFLLKNPDFQ